MTHEDNAPPKTISAALGESFNAHLNAKLAALDEAYAPPCFGWYWRDVDFTADSVRLAVAPEKAPSWWGSTFEAQFQGKAWTGGGEVRFCQNNKWGYREFTVEGEAWAKLRELVVALVELPTFERRDELVAHMNSLAPEGLAEEAI